MTLMRLLMVITVTIITTMLINMHDNDDDDDGLPCSQIFAYPPLPEKLF